MCFSNEFPWFFKQTSRPTVNTFLHVDFAFYIRRVFLDYIRGELHTSNLISFTKPIKCTYYTHNSIVFYHSNMFPHYCAIFTEFLHHVLKLTKTGECTFVIRTALGSKGHVAQWYIQSVMHYSNIMCASYYCGSSYKTGKNKNALIKFYFLYVVAALVCVYRHPSLCSIHRALRPCIS
jgi:hypothetical protein